MSKLSELKKTKPDWRQHGSMMGGRLGKYEHSGVRWFDNPDVGKRGVYATVGRYPGFRHQHVSMREDANPVWAYGIGYPEPTDGWWEPRDDADANGRLINRQCRTKKEATRFIWLCMLIVFGRMHQLVDDLGDPVPRTETRGWWQAARKVEPRKRGPFAGQTP
tara:strand:- start:235 stop:723 length:489 start_codon:yes stop_codon:yes gene_type:complete